ncbi:MAG: S-methyl-5-thioribose-1-phosphate isomerase [Candidatus Omnitrophica bacterium CG1_02_49_10]|nr:MAG: S-methyl-5-thioribose-1-phosphate isomerase [Candidatus Omnitrophica bacterium CG1_02_49_10]
MQFKTIDWVGGKVKLIDQTLLPERFRYIYCSNIKDLWKAIKRLSVRGAPAIGVAAAFGVVLGIKHSKAKTYNKFYNELIGASNYLATSRPTAVNLFWALERMRSVSRKNRFKSVAALKKILLEEARGILREDILTCRKIGKNGSALIKRGDSILTHCNAGALATGGMGTALSVIYQAKSQGKRIKVFADETRPLLQGSRLTAWELKKNGVDVTLICDDMAAKVMSEGRIDKVIVGADRIASNGDAANKIGTYGVAVLAKHHGIPFYVAAPVSTFDMSLKSGKDIPIEERDRAEIVNGFGRPTAPKGVKVYNPAFDVTPSGLISAIITEKGVFRPPYKNTLKALIKKRG